MNNTIPRILVVEDNPGDARLIQEMLQEERSAPHNVEWVTRLEMAVERLHEKSFDLVLLDLSLPDSRGVDTYSVLERHARSTPIIMMTGLSDESVALELVQKGAQDYLVKGEVDSRHLQRVIRYAIERARMLRELQESKRSLQAIKEQLENALENINEGLEAARLVQRSLLPDMLEDQPGFEASSVYLPCASIGGDLFDIVRIDERRTGLLILDVSGHGPHAALISAMAKISFTRNLTRHIDPAATLDAVNAELIHYIPGSLYLTACVAVIDTTDNTLSYSSAGHPPAMYINHAKERVEMLKTRGFFVGVLPESDYRQKRIAIAPGDTLMLYTDGLVDSWDSTDQRYGRDRLRSLLFTVMDKSPPEIATAIMSDLKSFTSGAPQLDDIAILVVQYGGVTGA
ncbi:MAG: SpoIIE family protein phosphatase [Chitinivibrionales bacterium]|nr:SpoIIE family protein phosphatase [Chitinivibrionales bacterium]MBD3356352.1 SpoIIE family protein phosphatase [Chitinivibrionales bacterium]